MKEYEERQRLRNYFLSNRGQDLYTVDAYRHVYDAMKRSRRVLGGHVESQQSVFFDSAPMAFEEGGAGDESLV